MNPRPDHADRWWITAKGFTNDLFLRFKVVHYYIFLPTLSVQFAGMIYGLFTKFSTAGKALFRLNMEFFRWWIPYYAGEQNKTYWDLGQEYEQSVIDYNIYFFKQLALYPLPLSLSVGLLLFLVLLYVAKTTRDGYISGSRLVSETELKKLAKKVGKTFFEIGKIPLPITSETSHIFIVGAPGRGKTLAVRKVIRKAISADKRGIILDIKGDWIPDVYRENIDLIFNPLDIRTIKWTVFNDIKDPIAIRNFCSWIIPVTNQKAPFFEESARFILESIMLKCIKTGNITNAEIRRLSSLTPYELSQELYGYGRGDTYVGEKGNKDVFASFQRAMAFIDFLEDGDFSITEFVNSSKPGFIFISNTSKTAQAFKPLLTAFVNVFAFTALQLPDDLSRRLYLFLDEFGRLGKIDTIKDLVLLGRSKGVSLWLTSQDLNQQAYTYSQDEMLSIINAFSTFAVMGLNEPKGAKYWSEKFGQQELFEISETIGMGPHVNRDGINLNKQKKLEWIVKDGDILNLETLTMYIKIDGIPACSKTKVEIIKANTNVPAIIEREISIDSMIKLMQSIEPANEQEPLEVEAPQDELVPPSDIRKNILNAEDFTY